MQGSVEEFRTNWQRPETKYCHWTRGEPVNQIQFAFRQNWLEFAKITEPLKPWAGKKCLEVGAGRGTMSMYFADAGFLPTLIDACQEPLDQSRAAFEKNNLSARFMVGDALSLPLEDESFDVVFSYGLLEHFDDILPPLKEQVRVLKHGGVLIAYVVPNSPNACDPMWSLISDTLGGSDSNKSPVYRNGKPCGEYGTVLEDIGLRDLLAIGVYPHPIISASPNFPFTMNSPEDELKIVAAFKKRNRWRCFPADGQGFIVWGWKR